MKATALALAFAVALTVPAAAQATKSKKAAKPADTMSEAQKTNDASWRIVKGSLPIFLPTWSLPIYMQLDKDQTPAEPKKAKARKAKATKQ